VIAKILPRCILALTVLTIPALSDDGWNWQNPLPQGNNLNGIEVIDPATAIAVGDAGTILTTLDGGQSWVSQRSGTNEDLLSVSFSDYQNGTAVGKNGTILRTDDGGFTWVQQPSGTNGTLRGVKFTDGNNGTVVEGLGRILRTTNAGDDWSQVTTPNVPGLYSVSFCDPTCGTAVGTGGRILHTSNGGADWFEQSSGTVQDLFAVYFVTPRHGVAVGFGGTVVRTTDSGTTWNTVNAGTLLPLLNVVFVDSLRGMAVGLPGTNFHTVDGGLTWTTRPSGTSNLVRGADFANENDGYAVGSNGTIMYTPNGGSNWFAQSSGTSNSLFGVSFPSIAHGIAVGDVGTILRTTNGGTSWFTQNSGTNRTLWSVSLANTTNGNAVGSNGTILRTNNGGTNWVAQSSGTVSQLLGVSLADASVATAVGVGGLILRTPDGGATWSPQFSGTPQALNAVYMVDANTAVAVGSGGVILRTDDGSLWIDVPSGTTQNLYGVHFRDALNGTVVGAGGLIMKTADGGANWTIQASGTGNTLNSVVFASNDIGSAAGYAGTILRTENGGANWSFQASGTNNYLASMDFADGNNGTVVGFGGTILHTTTGGQPPAPFFSPNSSSLDFATVIVGASKTDSIIITNTGTATLSLNSVASTSTRFTVTPTGAAIPASSSRKFYVTFSPVSTGLREASIVFTSNASGSPDSILVMGTGTTEGFGKYLTLSPDSIIKKDPSTGKVYKPAKRNRGQYPNWSNLVSEIVAQGGFQPGASEGDAAGGMIVGISHMYQQSPTKWKVIRDSANVRCWVRLSKWNFAKNYGSNYSYIQKTLEDNTGKHTAIPRGFDATGVPGDPNRKPLLRQQTRLYPRKHNNALFAEAVALKLNIAASQMGKTPVGFGELVFDMEGNLCHNLSLLQISAKTDSMLTYWQGRSQVDYDSLYRAIYIINRAFLGVLDTLSFEADQELIADGAVDLGNVSFLKPGLGPELRTIRTSHAGETEDDADFGAEEFEEAEGTPVLARLYQNYPNPFNPTTAISFRLRQPSRVTLKVYSVLGQEIGTLVSGEQLEEGLQTVEFHADGLASGVYFYQLRAEGEEEGDILTEARKFVLMK